MRGVNKVTLIGNVGADPETRYTQNGSAITTLRLATSDSWTDKQSGQKQERTEWHRVKMFGKLAEVAGEYVKKGRQIYVEGSIRTEKYTDKEGAERFSTDIIANEMQLLGGERQRDSREPAGDHPDRDRRDGAATSRGQGGGRDVAPPRAPAGRVAPQRSAPREPAPAIDDDDIPF